MHPFVNIFIGMLLAWAFCKPSQSKTDELGIWRYVIGALCGIYPHLDELLNLYSLSLYQQYAYGLTWSLVLIPFVSFALSFSFAKLIGKPLELVWPVTFFTMVAVSVLGVFTENGVALLEPFWDFQFRLSLVNSFDINFVLGSSIFLLIGALIPQFRVHISRFGFLLMIIYMIVLGGFHLRAYSFAKDYAKAMRIDVVKYHVLPQPISTFNWRILIESSDDKIHDTRVNLFRKQDVRVRHDFNRSKRLDAQYKPLNTAVWRVYRRFGRQVPDQARAAWDSDVRKGYEKLTELSVYLGVKKVEGNNCFIFQDLRYSGSKEKERGRFMFCRHAPNKYTFYRALDEGRYVVLAMMY